MGRLLTALFGIIILMTSAISFAGGCADVNNSGNINLMDVAYIINHLYRGGPDFNCGTSSTGVCGDVNANGTINLMDVAYIINFLYRNGPAPNCGEVTDIDGNKYQIVTIGAQVWMAENLKVTHYRNGEIIPNITDGTIWNGLTTGAYCEYNNDINNVATYGRLYNWYAVADSRNIAPTGWHVPTDTEWQTLVDYLGGNNIAGGKMKEAGSAHWSCSNTGATNESGFTALPGGYISNNTYMELNYHAYYLSVIGSDIKTPWCGDLSCFNLKVQSYSGPFSYGYSVRCVRD